MVKEVKKKLSLASVKIRDFTTTNRFVLAGQKALIGMGFFALTPLSVFAIPENINPTDMVNKLISMVCTIFGLIGALLLAWAIGSLVSAFRNEDADSKSRAMQAVIVAVLLCSVKLIYESVTGDTVEPFDLG
jgi:hypothetical protein